MSHSHYTKEDGWITVSELTVNGCEEVSEAGNQSTLAESLGGSLAAAALPGLSESDSGHSVKSSPTASEAHSIPMGHIDNVVDGLPSIRNKSFESITARDMMGEETNYVIAANLANRNHQPRVSRAAMPRTCSDVLNSTSLVDLFPNLASAPLTKVAAWIETCKRSAEESYEARQTPTPPSPEIDEISKQNGNENEQQQDPATDNAGGSRQRSQEPGSDSELPEDPHTH